MLKKLGCGIVAILIVLFAIGVFSGGSETSRSTNVPLSVPEKLAIIDQNTSLVSDHLVKVYEQKFSKLTAKCDGNIFDLSDTIVHATNVITDKKGFVVNNWKMMTMIDEAVPENLKLDCMEVVAALIALM